MDVLEPSATDVEGLLAGLLAALDDEGLEYCVERNFLHYPHEVTGDVDLLFRPGDLAAALEVCTGSARSMGWDRFYSALGTQTFHVGFFSAQQAPSQRFALVVEGFGGGIWRGVEFLPADQVLEERRRVRSFWAPAEEHEFTITVAHHLLYSARVPAKYHARLRSLHDQKPEACLGVLSGAIGDYAAMEVLSHMSGHGPQSLRNIQTRARWHVVKQQLIGRVPSGLVQAMRAWADRLRRSPGLMIVLESAEEDMCRGLAREILDLGDEWHLFMPPLRVMGSLHVRNEVRQARRVVKGGGVAVLIGVPGSRSLPGRYVCDDVDGWVVAAPQAGGEDSPHVRTAEEVWWHLLSERCSDIEAEGL